MMYIQTEKNTTQRETSKERRRKPRVYIENRPLAKKSRGAWQHPKIGKSMVNTPFVKS